MIPGAHEPERAAFEHFAQTRLAGAHHHDRVVREQEAFDVASVEVIAGKRQKAAIHGIDGIG